MRCRNVKTTFILTKRGTQEQYLANNWGHSWLYYSLVCNARTGENRKKLCRMKLQLTINVIFVFVSSFSKEQCGGGCVRRRRWVDCYACKQTIEEILTFNELLLNVESAVVFVLSLALPMLLLPPPSADEVPSFLRGDVDRRFRGDVSDTLPTLYSLPSCTRNSLATALRSAFLTTKRKSVSSANTILFDFCT